MYIVVDLTWHMYYITTLTDAWVTYLCVILATVVNQRHLAVLILHGEIALVLGTFGRRSCYHIVPSLEGYGLLLKNILSGVASLCHYKRHATVLEKELSVSFAFKPGCFGENLLIKSS